MKRFFWLLIRLLTLPCLLNEGLLVLLRLRKQYFDSLTFWLLTAAMCLVPIAGYLLNLCKNQSDNDKRRKNAMIASLIGYCAGTAAVLIMRRPVEELIILLTYLISGLLIAVFSLCGVRASGHAAGIAGPFFIAAYLRVMPLFLLLLLLRLPNWLQLLLLPLLLLLLVRLRNWIQLSPPAVERQQDD